VLVEIAHVCDEVRSAVRVDAKAGEQLTAMLVQALVDGRVVGVNPHAGGPTGGPDFHEHDGPARRAAFGRILAHDVRKAIRLVAAQHPPAVHGRR